MKYEFDDPRLTAYALGELDDTEKAGLEAFLNENEDARDEVARIREAAKWLSTELGTEVPEGLSELEQARIVDQAKKAWRESMINWAGWLSVAVLLIVIGAGALFTIGPRMIETAGGGYSMMAAQERVKRSSNIVNEGGSVSANAPVAIDEKAQTEAESLARRTFKAPSTVTPSPGIFSGVDTKSASAPPQPFPAEELPRDMAAAPETPPAKQNVGWDQIGTKTMSQQAVIDLPTEPAKQVSASAPAPTASPAAAPAASGTGGNLQNVTVGGNLRIRGNEVAAAEKAKEKKDRAPVLGDIPGYAAAAPASPPAQANDKEQMRALGYVGANAPASKAEEKKPDLAKGGIVAEQDARIMPRPMPVPPPPPTPVPGSESYPVMPENNFQRVVDAPLSTFGMDVDTASYANVRRFLSQGTLPPGEAVRIEELVNYFKYDYPKPEGDAPFSVTVDAHPCPWAPTHTLARIGLHGRELDTETRPPANLVFLIDVSGSMQDADKLPLLKKGMKLLTQTVTANDRVSIVTYASGTGVALYPTSGDNKVAIERIIDGLSAGGSTNGEGGIQAAYDLARRAFIQGGVNRVILATDGDFNVGISDTGTLVGMIEQQAKTGVALSVLGFGQGNLKDERMMKLADKGNGNYSYIDSFQEARKVLLEQAMGTLFTIAKDVKIQIEFNPAKVGAYRLIGYEKRMLAAQDFNDDRKDAGEIGAGHTVTALYELVPPGEQVSPPQTDPLKYQTNAAPAPEPPASDSPELMTVKLRFKPPTGDVSTRFDVPIPATVVTAETRPDFQFASAVAAFGMLLRHSTYAGTASMDMVINLAQQGKGTDTEGLRAEFINLARTASALMGTSKQ